MRIIGVRDLPSAIRRTGLISVINLVPLALGGHINPVISRLIKPRSYERIHRWVGRVAIAEASIHSILAAVFKNPDLHSPPLSAAVSVSLDIHYLRFPLSL